MTLKELERRVAALLARHPAPPTLEQFRESWASMDELSKSLYQTALACPELVGADGQYWQTVNGYLERMGYTAEPFTIDEILASLESDR